MMVAIYPAQRVLRAAQAAEAAVVNVSGHYMPDTMDVTIQQSPDSALFSSAKAVTTTIDIRVPCICRRCNSGVGATGARTMCK